MFTSQMMVCRNKILFAIAYSEYSVSVKIPEQKTTDTGIKVPMLKMHAAKH